MKSSESDSLEEYGVLDFELDESEVDESEVDETKAGVDDLFRNFLPLGEDLRRFNALEATRYPGEPPACLSVLSQTYSQRLPCILACRV